MYLKGIDAFFFALLEECNYKPAIRLIYSKIKSENENDSVLSDVIYEFDCSISEIITRDKADNKYCRFGKIYDAKNPVIRDPRECSFLNIDIGEDFNFEFIRQLKSTDSLYLLNKENEEHKIKLEHIFRCSLEGYRIRHNYYLHANFIVVWNNKNRKRYGRSRRLNIS